MDEMLYHVDAADRVVGPVSRFLAHRPESSVLHRAVHILLREEDGGVILQRRHKPRGLNDGYWTSTASGHVRYGLTYEDAARAELVEETLNKLEATVLTRIGTLLLQAQNQREVCDAWTALFTGVSPVLAAELTGTDGEADCFASFSLAVVRESIQNGTPLLDPWGGQVLFADNFPPVIETYAAWLAGEGGT